MALFSSDSDEKRPVTRKAIRSTVVHTQNVAKELLSIAKSYSVKVDTIDFNILEVQTYTRMKEEEKETEWEELRQEEIYELEDESALLNKFFEIKQMYEVEFFNKKVENNPFENFNVAIGANATKCKIYLSIKEGSQITYSSRFAAHLKNYINKNKVRAGILINIFDEMLDKVVSKLIAHLRVEEKIHYKKNETLLIAQSYEPTLTINDSLIFHYEEQDETDDQHKVDYASRGYIKSVQKDEVLIEYIKAQLGTPGRNCRGIFIAPKEILEKFIPKFTVDETIREVDNPKNIEYTANENGYVRIKGKVYGIKTEMDIQEISFKTTGNITSGLDSDVNISVTEKDTEKDAIGSGMEVEVTEINIDGNVGSNARLSAVKATISGQTHKTAEIRADKLNINIHKGKAFGKNIYITRLEHGRVEGDEVSITQALGGDIRATEINIEVCASHVKATASKLIEIHKLQGSENTFTIDPLLKQSAKSGLNENNDAIKRLEQELKEIKKDVNLFAKQVKEGTASFNDVKKRLVHYKKNGIKMPESFVKKYKQFQILQKNLEAKNEFYTLKKNELDIAMSKTSIFQMDIMDARVINRDRWKGFNEIIFKLIDPPLDLIYKPQEGSSGKIFGLVEVDEGEFEIQVLDE